MEMTVTQAPSHHLISALDQMKGEAKILKSKLNREK